MKRSKFSEEQVITVLRRWESGESVRELSREFSVTEQTLYLWKKKYADCGVPELKKLRQQDDEIKRLKRLVADLMLDKQILQDVIAKKL